MPKVTEPIKSLPTFTCCWALLKYLTGQFSFTALALTQNLVFIKMVPTPSLPQRAIMPHFFPFLLSCLDRC